MWLAGHNTRAVLERYDIVSPRIAAPRPQRNVNAEPFGNSATQHKRSRGARTHFHAE